MKIERPQKIKTKKDLKRPNSKRPFSGGGGHEFFFLCTISPGGDKQTEPNVCLEPNGRPKTTSLCTRVDRPSVSEIPPPFLPDPPVKDGCGRYADHS